MNLYRRLSDPKNRLFPWLFLAGGIGVDILLFNLLTHMGLSQSSANAVSFLATSAVMTVLAGSPWSIKTITLKGIFKWSWPVLMIVFLRGGIFSTLTAVFQFFPSVVITAGLSWPFYLFFIESINSQKLSSDIADEFYWRRLILVLIAYFIGLRIFYMGSTELIMEEAYYWNYAKHLDIGYLDHPPMVAWLIWLTTRIFGDTEFAVRIGAFGCWGVAAVFIHRWASRMFDQSSAMLSVLLTASLPFFFGIGLTMSPDAPLTACWAGSLFFLHQGLVKERKSGWLFAGICVGLGLLSKYTIILLVPATLIYMAIDPISRKWFFRWEPYLAAVLAFILFLPVIIWNADHNWASFYFQGPKRIEGNFNFTFHLLILSAFLMLTPAGIAAAISIFKNGLQQWVQNRLTDQSPANRSAMFSVVFILTPFSVFACFSLFRQFKLDWIGPLFLALIPMIGNQIAHARVDKPVPAAQKLQRAWPATFMTLAFLYGGFLYYVTIGIPGVPYPQNISLFGWEEMGRQIDKISEDIFDKTGKTPIVAGMDAYKTANGVAFYRIEACHPSTDRLDDAIIQNTTSRNAFGMNGLMYQYWLSQKNLEGRDMILVACKPKDLKIDGIKSYFDKIGDLQKIDLTKNGKPAGECYYRIGQGYRIQ